MGWTRAAARLALALGVVSMSACLKDDSGSSQSQTGIGASTPLIWVNQAAGGTGTNTNTPLSDVWIDATTVTATGAGAILPSTDEVTYGFPTQYLQPNDPNLPHPIMTNSAARAILDPEDALLKLINNHRLITLGGANQIPGGINQGGGVPIGGIQITAIPPSGSLRKNARAHCKHYGRNNHGAGFPAGMAANAEGDTLIGGNVQTVNGKSTPAGRLRKGKLTLSSTQFAEETHSGPTWNTAQNTFDNMLNNNSMVLSTTGYGYIGIGHWPQGPDSYYWDIILGNGLSPIN